MHLPFRSCCNLRSSWLCSSRRILLCLFLLVLFLFRHLLKWSVLRRSLSTCRLHRISLLLGLSLCMLSCALFLCFSEGLVPSLVCITLPQLACCVCHFGVFLKSFFINLNSQKPLRTAVFRAFPLEVCPTYLICFVPRVSCRPTFPTSHPGQSPGRIQPPGRSRISVLLCRKDVVLRLVGSRCPDVHPCKLRNTSRNPARCKSGTCLSPAMLRGRSLLSFTHYGRLSPNSTSLARTSSGIPVALLPDPMALTFSISCSRCLLLIHIAFK